MNDIKIGDFITVNGQSQEDLGKGSFTAAEVLLLEFSQA